MYCSMKMSLCNTFRLFFITTIVLSIIDTHAAFTLRRTVSSHDYSDLDEEESVNLEVKYDLKRPNDVPLDFMKTPNTIQLYDENESTESMVQSNMIMTSNSNLVMTTEESIKETTDKATEISDPVPESTTRYNEFTENPVIKTDIATLTTSKEPSPIPVSRTTFSDSGTTIQGPKMIKIYEVTQPFWKKYTTIDRIRATPTTPIALLSNETEGSYSTENIEKAETKKPSRVSLQDASDIGSLEKLKIELLLTTMNQQAAEKQPATTILTTMNQQAAEKQPATTILTELTVTEEPIDSTVTNLATFTSTQSSTSSVPKLSVESKRAGYLDFSPKTTTDEKPIVPAESASKNNEKETLRAMFEVENETEVPEEKTYYRVDSQSQLSEDALKEELMKENILSNNEENAIRFREESLTTKKINLAPETQINNSQHSAKNITYLDDELKVKPINLNTEKNTILYPVNPNYKPLKKIDVQPPKLFLRDPDDNTWRNESLSSRGIVFNPSNSSKPFTQVLKNKTESEWNIISEKENTNDTPDLKERLQKISEMRKSKRKKIDSYGNVVYFDYEENNGSGESVNLSREDITRAINATTPSISSFVKASSVSSDQPVGIITTSTIDAAFAKEFRVSSTEKPRKFFNVPEYYDNTDDEDVDYLNMAKLDIKKFTTSNALSTTTTTPTTGAWPGLKLGDKKNHIIFPDRKATVQYFPPLKTLKSNINDYDDNFKIKLNSYTTVSDQPKYVLPVSTTTTSTMTPEHRTTIHYNKYKSNRKDYSVATKPNIFRDLYLTRSTTTTEDFLSPGDGGDGYVIKHYRDFVNKAAKDAEYDKNLDYTPYTDVPVQGVTKSEFGTYDKDKSKINMSDDYDEDAQLRKDVLQTFVNNFNHNSHRFKSDFPVLFNNSVIHGEYHNGREIASSHAFMRGLYQNRLKSKARACDPRCDNFTVELSPAYELHYYVPDQEEKQEALPPITPPYRDM